MIIKTNGLGRLQISCVHGLPLPVQAGIIHKKLLLVTRATPSVGPSPLTLGGHRPLVAGGCGRRRHLPHFNAAFKRSTSCQLLGASYNNIVGNSEMYTRNARKTQNKNRWKNNRKLNNCSRKKKLLLSIVHTHTHEYETKTLFLRRGRRFSYDTCS